MTRNISFGHRFDLENSFNTYYRLKFVLGGIYLLTKFDNNLNLYISDIFEYIRNTKVCFKPHF